jgi:hypothetical protein
VPFVSFNLLLSWVKKEEDSFMTMDGFEWHPWITIEKTAILIRKTAALNLLILCLTPPVHHSSEILLNDFQKDYNPDRMG